MYLYFLHIIERGVPRVLLEASIIGLGLITTNMPGCRDVVLMSILENL